MKNCTLINFWPCRNRSIKSSCVFFHWSEFTKLSFLPNFSSQLCQPGGFSIRILLFGKLELDLRSVSHPPSWGLQENPTPKNTFAVLKNEWNYFFILKTQRKSLENSQMARINLSNGKFDVFNIPTIWTQSHLV